jgi:hypothetical protein
MFHLEGHPSPFLFGSYKVPIYTVAAISVWKSQISNVPMKHRQQFLLSLLLSNLETSKSDKGVFRILIWAGSLGKNPFLG